MSWLIATTAASRDAGSVSVANESRLDVDHVAAVSGRVGSTQDGAQGLPRVRRAGTGEDDPEALGVVDLADLVVELVVVDLLSFELDAEGRQLLLDDLEGDAAVAVEPHLGREAVRARGLRKLRLRGIEIG